MPRRPAQVNQADVQRIIRACRREKVPFKITLEPHGAAVFESAEAEVREQDEAREAVR